MSVLDCLKEFTNDAIEELVKPGEEALKAGDILNMYVYALSDEPVEREKEEDLIFNFEEFLVKVRNKSNIDIPIYLE